MDGEVQQYINGWLEQAHVGVRGYIPAATDRSLVDDLAVLAEYQRVFLSYQDSKCFASDLH